VLHIKLHERPLLVKDGIIGEKWSVNLAWDFDFHVNNRVLVHAANLRHGTDGFTFLSEGRHAVDRHRETKKIGAEVAGRRTFRILPSSQQSGYYSMWTALHT
jgi:hypothetical protein